MLKTLLTSTVLAGVLSVSAIAQDLPPADPAIPEAGGDAPVVILPTPEAGPDAPDSMLEAEGPQETWAPVAIETVAAEELDGADIRTVFDDQRVATVGATLVGADGTVEGVVAQFGGFLGFGREQVVLSADEIEVFKDADGRVLVRTDLTREALEAMPEYEG